VDLAKGLGQVCLPISDIPLDTELQAAPANIMFILDDSGSMCWEFMTPETNGLFKGYTYLFDSKTGDPCSGSTLGSGGGDNRALWQFQYSGYNKMYYNPVVIYEPWPTKESLSHPDKAYRFPGINEATSNMSDLFYDLDTTGQAGSPVKEPQKTGDPEADLIVDNEDQPELKVGETIVTIDNNDLGYSEPEGSWTDGSAGEDDVDYEGTGYRHTENDGKATWDFNTHDSGKWRVEVRFKESASWTTSATYIINHISGKTTKTPINQQQHQGRWVDLGEYEFAENAAQVDLEYTADGQRVCADAVRLVKVLDPEVGRRFQIITGKWKKRDNSNEAYVRPSENDWFYDTNDGTSGSHVVRWYPYVDEDTTYEIFTRFRDIGTYGTNIRYTICYDGGTCVTSTQITQDQGKLGGKWNPISFSTEISEGNTTKFRFRGGASAEKEFVELSWDTSVKSKDACADAIAWVKEKPVAVRVKMANSHYYVQGTDDEIYLVNLTGNVGPPNTLKREVYLFASADKDDPRDTVDSGDLVPVIEPKKLADVGLLIPDNEGVVVDKETDGTTTSLQVRGLIEPADVGALFTVEDDASGAFYEVTGGDSNTINTDTKLPKIPEGKKITIYRSPEQDRRNFANWFSFYRARHLAAKGAVAHAINQIGGVQIGLYSLWGRINQSVLKVDVGPPGERIDRTNDLLKLLYDFDDNRSSTPLRRALQRVGEYYHNEDGKSGGIKNEQGNTEGDDATLVGEPWYPGDEGGACQQSFAILMTDGFWNGSGGSAPSGIGDEDKNMGRPYQENPTTTATDIKPTLADVAMKFWNTDMSKVLADDVPTNFRDPNNRQHMVTYTVAFGVKGSLNPNDYDLYNTVETDRTFPNWADANPMTCSNCPEKIDDMWHAAVNGHGIFLSAEDPGQLVSSLTDVIQNVISRIGSGASVSVNGEDLYAGTVMFQSSYSTDGWTGDVKAYEVVTIDNQQAGEKIGDVRFDNPLWSASFELGDALPKANPDWKEDSNWNRTSWDTGRVIATYNPGKGVGTPFRLDGLTDTQKSWLPTLKDDPADQTLRKINYIRGENKYEADKIGGTFRTRLSKLGDIVHSSPLYEGYFDEDRDTLYGVLFVGGNDGMLHAFYADQDKDHPDNGKELFAYVPNLVFPKLNDLTLTTRTHQYYVDATPFVQDMGKTKILVGSLGRGGNGMYALDVTAPLTHTEKNAGGDPGWVLWEYPKDETPQDQRDQLGYTYARPFVLKSNDPAVRLDCPSRQRIRQYESVSLAVCPARLRHHRGSRGKEARRYGREGDHGLVRHGLQG